MAPFDLSLMYLGLEDRHDIICTEATWLRLLPAPDLLADHPRQDADALSLVQRQKSFFNVGEESFHWFKNLNLNPNRPRAVPDRRPRVVISDSDIGDDDMDADMDVDTDNM